MPRQTYADAAKFSTRNEQEFDVLKPPYQGGPSYAKYSTADQRDSQYVRDHPRYPDFVYPDDRARDTYYEAKAELAADPTRFGLTFASDADIQYITDKRNMQELVAFKQFVENSIPRGTPWARDFFNRILPGWYESKKDIILKKMDILNRFAELSVVGIQSIDDMYLLWLLYTGKVVLPTNIEQVIRPDNQGIDHTTFQYGLFNPKRWITNTLRLAWRNQKTLANLAIPGVDLKGLDPNDNIGVTYPQQSGNGLEDVKYARGIVYPGYTANGAYYYNAAQKAQSFPHYSIGFEERLRKDNPYNVPRYRDLWQTVAAPSSSSSATSTATTTTTTPV